MYHVCVVEVVHPCTSRAACYFGCLPIMPLFHAAPSISGFSDGYICSRTEVPLYYLGCCRFATRHLDVKSTLHVLLRPCSPMHSH